MIIKNEKILNEYRQEGTCEVCGKWFSRRQVHHRYPRGMGGGMRYDVPVNLMSVCAICHLEKIHGGQYCVDKAVKEAVLKELHKIYKSDECVFGLWKTIQQAIKRWEAL